MNFSGKVVLVTGASRGIGRKIAERFALAGAKVGINYAHNDLLASQLKEELESKGAEVLLVKGDVSQKEEVERIFKELVTTFGKIDIVVNNAGITKDKLLLRMSYDDFDSVIKTNLYSTFLVTREAAKIMLKQRFGRIINISSVVGIKGNAGQANYAASKAAIIGFTKAVALELASRGITVNAVAPGYIKTDMTEKLDEKVKEALLNAIPAERLGTPDDVAAAVLFLASEGAGYITGQTIVVDGGMVM
ncbi:3-oxoacyl-[acyl-carrier-protein] reductase [Carboxydothermus hydrogenoformans]|uniref:3-oxoacyl-[acyl-carrier-protein] reductase n=1 Tax=Carboxydothermus hydrogenoformans (strain ATCC BAA-161 / DSM 6008 / Z-2901) TaxID=246194 RepID=Q3AC55_CARHZ|nr:3-oxoacyl-[acyl-carrier-protein] reductase [Carboxydothermus hydrogenoformans]ABB15691.1 3-oxoacyl-(acyl-carrier-protein) reductase [Carboxydothermus hydrogenoformans Z-2901]